MNEAGAGRGLSYMKGNNNSQTGSWVCMVWLQVAPEP